MDPQPSRAVSAERRPAPRGRSDPPARRSWPAEVWLSFRPYCVALTVDFLVFVVLWSSLRGMHALAARLPMSAAVAEFLSIAQGVAVLTSFAFVTSLALFDIREIHGRR